MSTVTQVRQALQEILTEEADELGRQTGFVQRARKFSGATFVQTLLFGWMANPEASLEGLGQAAAVCGVIVSPQAIAERLNSAAAVRFLQAVVAAALAKVITSKGADIAFCERFNGVYLVDSSSITLPLALREDWPASGNGSRQRAGLKLEVAWDYSRGQLAGLYVEPGNTNDRQSQVQHLPLPAGSLRLADLGYFKVAHLAQMDSAGVYWLSRVQSNTHLIDEAGQQWDLASWLGRQQTDRVDSAIRLGAADRLPCRLVAVRTPQTVAQQRRRRLRQEAKRRGYTPSKTSLRLAGWLLLVTNLPPDRLSLDEALVLARVRWQIELLFKLWKSQGRLDQSRSHQPYRILAEFFAKLLIHILQHWLLAMACWQFPDRSLTKAVQSIRHHALVLATSLADPRRLAQALHTIQRCLAAGCRINKRRQAPHLFQLLLALPAVPALS